LNVATTPQKVAMTCPHNTEPSNIITTATSCSDVVVGAMSP
jgi:hypothetical protein